LPGGGVSDVSRSARPSLSAVGAAAYDDFITSDAPSAVSPSAVSP
jgi:hypothetical protein